MKEIKKHTLEDIVNRAYYLDIIDKEEAEFELDVITALRLVDEEYDVYQGTQVIKLIMNGIDRILSGIGKLESTTYIKADEAMKLLNCTRNTLCNYCKRGIIRHNSLGRDYNYNDVMRIVLSGKKRIK